MRVKVSVSQCLGSARVARPNDEWRFASSTLYTLTRSTALGSTLGVRTTCAAAARF